MTENLPPDGPGASPADDAETRQADRETQPEAKPKAAPPKPKGYTAVVYFHGMGSQRRYEEISRLIDAIDKFLSNAFRKRNEKKGFLTNIRPKIEPSRVEDDETITYIRTKFANPGDDANFDHPEVRVYEAYWAPVMAGLRSPVGVAKWVLKQAIRPFQTLRIPWRERQRLRRSALVELQEWRRKWPAGTEERDFDRVLRLYTSFGGLSAKRSFPEGSFLDFLRFIDTKTKDRPNTARRLKSLASAWHGFYKRGEFRNAIVLITILLAIALIAGLLVVSVLSLIRNIWDVTIPFLGDNPLRDVFNLNEPSFATAAGLTLSIVMAAGLGRFLTKSMGDVEAWSTYEETDEKHQKRRRVLDEGSGLIRHVLADPRCDRVVVVSHSLGTSVAHDTLLLLARENRATNPSNPIEGPVPLERISHFVTIASPIDKINYFFESTRSSFHRYTRVVETLRGDISKPPFAKNRHPHVHWVNFWDEADVISGALHSPVGRDSLRNKVDNVHIANLNTPDPGASHSAYFGNRTVIERLYEMIYLNRYSYSDLPMREDNKGYDYESVQLGPGEGRGKHRLFHLGSLAVPWLVLIGLVLLVAGAKLAGWVFLLGALAISGVLIASWKINKGMGWGQDL